MTFSRCRLVGWIAGFFLLTLGTSSSVNAFDCGGRSAAPDRLRGLLVGTLIGDSAGGPWEFQVPSRSVWTTRDQKLGAEGIRALAQAFRLRAYPFKAAPYAQWEDFAPAGTLTDDSRHKILLIRALSQGALKDPHILARTYVQACEQGPYHAYPSLCRDWLSEYLGPALWELSGGQDARAFPADRLWGGVPTVYGAMTLLPIALRHAGEPRAAYLEAWNLDFMETGYGKDLSSAWVAALAEALRPGSDWPSVWQAMKDTDPFGFSKVPWVDRELSRWMRLGREISERGQGVPARVFALLEKELPTTTWWEAWVPVVVLTALSELSQGDPLALLQLILEFGHDTDTYGQLAGALLGAMHGEGVFPPEMRAAVERTLLGSEQLSVDDLLRMSCGAPAGELSPH